MQPLSTSADAVTRRHRPKTLTVFAAAFAAGAVLAYGVDRVVDVHVVQAEPQVESEPIFVALRSLPQGAPVTVWDVALKDWPKAMLPTTALKADASFEGMVLRLPIREGQPLLSVQLVRDGSPLPGARVAALPAAAQPVGPSAWTAAQPADRPAPAAAAVAEPAATTERFVPATPAEPAVAAATGPAPAADVVPAAPAADVAPHVTAEFGDAAVPTPGVPGVAEIADTDIEPIVDSGVETVVEPVAQPAVEPLPAVSAAGPDRIADPAVVAVVQPLPALVAAADVAAGARAEPTVAQADPAPSAVSAAPMPLAAPVPALPTTDIERSLAEFGRQVPKPQETPSTSVLDRTTAEPTPAPTYAAPPKHHLVIPERVALAADASFTEQPRPTTAAEVPPGAAVAGGSGAQGGTAPTRVGSRTPQAQSAPQKNAAGAASASRRPAAGRQSSSTKATGMKAAGTRPQARAAAQSTSKPAATPQAAPAKGAQGVSAWLQQFSGGSRQR